MSLLRHARAMLLLATTVAALSACAPERRAPSFAVRQNAPLAGLPQGQAAFPQPQWWRRYNDAQLDHLMELATAGSPDLQQAQARYQSAQYAVAGQRAKLRPEVEGAVGGSLSYGKANLHASPAESGDFSNINVSPSHTWSDSGLAGALFTWDLDLWGKQKDALKQAIGTANAAEAERAMAANALHASVARAYFDWQSMQARIALSQQSVDAATQFQKLITLRVKHGLDDPQQLDQANAQLAEQRRTLAQQQGQAALDLVALAQVVAVPQAQLAQLQAMPLPNADTSLPPDASLALLSRRPDIVADRWQIEASINGIDAARAAYYPDVSLDALAGFLRLYPDLGSGTKIDLGTGAIAPSMTLPIFSGGRLKAQFESSQGQLDTAVASYNKAVVDAAHDVAQQVTTLQELVAVNGQQDAQTGAIQSQYARANHRLAQGLIDERTTIGLQLQINQAHDSQLQLASQLLDTNIALIEALGGGYQSTDAPSLSDTAAPGKHP